MELYDEYHAGDGYGNALDDRKDVREIAEKASHNHDLRYSYESARTAQTAAPNRTTSRIQAMKTRHSDLIAW
jgi:hypothetical protein